MNTYAGRSARDNSIDRLRGLAMLLMLLGHGLSAFDTGLWIRLTLTRASLPIFALCTGYLLANRLPRLGRVGQVAAVGLGSSLLAIPGLDAVDPLLVVAAALAFWPAARRWPFAVMVAGIVQGYTFKGFYDGYQVGHVLSLMVAGLLLRRAGQATPAIGLPIGALGRFPLTVYAGHLLILWITTTAA